MGNKRKRGHQSDGSNKTLQKGVGQVLMTLAGLGLILTIWQVSSFSPHEAGNGESAPQKTAFSPAAQHGASKREVAISPLISEERKMESMWAQLLAAHALENQAHQTAVVSRLMENMTPEMAEKLLLSLKSEELKCGAAQQLFDHWATANSGKAAAWAQGLGDLETNKSFLNVAALRWAVADLGEATVWARNLPEGESRFEIMAAIGNEAVRNDPLAALNLAVELPAGAAQTDLMTRGVTAWANTDSDSAMAWADKIEDKALREKLIGGVVLASAEQNPADAAKIALQKISPGDEQDRMIITIVQYWAQADPAVASAWVSKFPENSVGQSAIRTLVPKWASQNPEAVGEWLITLKKGELRNAGITAYAEVLRLTDEASANRWALKAASGY